RAAGGGELDRPVMIVVRCIDQLRRDERGAAVRRAVVVEGYAPGIVPVAENAVRAGIATTDGDVVYVVRAQDVGAAAAEVTDQSPVHVHRADPEVRGQLALVARGRLPCLRLLQIRIDTRVAGRCDADEVGAVQVQIDFTRLVQL